MPRKPAPQSSRTPLPLQLKLGIPLAHTQPRSPPPSPPAHPAASGLCSTSSAKTSAELAVLARSGAPSLPPKEQKLPPKDPQTRQTHPAHCPARGPRQWGSRSGGKGCAPGGSPPRCPRQPRAPAAPRRGHKPPPSPQIAAPVRSAARAGWPGARRSRPALNTDPDRRAASYAALCGQPRRGARQRSARRATPTRPRRSSEKAYAVGPRRWTEA